MATTAFPMPPTHRPWDDGSPRPPSSTRQTSSRPRSQPQSERSERSKSSRRTEKRGPNSVKARPAKEAVINGILDSLETLPAPTYLSVNDEHAWGGSRRHSRPYTSDGNFEVAPSPPLPSPTSPGFGVGLGTVPVLDEEESATDIAPFPAVRTSRRPSGLKTYRAPKPPSVVNQTPERVLVRRRSSSLNSRRSSLSLRRKERKDRERMAGKNKLSAESWVKQGTNGVDSDDEKASQHQPRGRKTVRAMDSQEDILTPLRKVETAPPMAISTPSRPLSLAEQIIAKANERPTSSSKRRLYLTDSVYLGKSAEHASPRITDEIQKAEQEVGDSSTHVVDVLQPTERTESPEVEDHDDIIAHALEQEPEEVFRTISGPSVNHSVDTMEPEPDTEPRNLSVDEINLPKRNSPQKSPIEDSIPMRTSSLRLSSSSPAGRKRDRKSKRLSRAEVTPEGSVERASKHIPDSSWADLGEDDQTVKRIRQLREKRKSRQLETKTLADITARQSSDIPSFRPSEDVLRERPEPTRMATEPASLAEKIIAKAQENEQPDVDDVYQVNGSGTMRRKNLSLDEKKLSFRPATSQSDVSPPLSLDYSYSDAVDALQGVRRDMKRKEKSAGVSTPPRVPSPLIRSPDADSVETRSATTTPLRQPSKSSRRRKPHEWLYKSNHPDLPIDAERRRARRKSTSDATHSRQLDYDGGEALSAEQLERVDAAVNDYLQDSRLTRQIKHPITGRVISYSEVGDPNGAVVLVCVGMGLTRYVTAFYDELAATLRLRLITIDRPGVGCSAPYPANDKSGPLNWPDDVLAVCQHLGVTKFSMLAHSAGAIYALATALILPHLVKGKVHLLAPWIPPSQLEALSHPAASGTPGGTLPRSQRFLRALPAPFLKAANASFMTATSASLKPATKRKSGGKTDLRRQDPTQRPPSQGQERPPSRDAKVLNGNRRESMMLMDQEMPEVTPNDPFTTGKDSEDSAEMPRKSPYSMSATTTSMDPNLTYASTDLSAAEHAEVLFQNEYTALLTQRTWELATRDSNPATDLLVCLERYRDVGFRYTDVGGEVVITHGSDDKRVPVQNVRWLAQQMNYYRQSQTTPPRTAPERPDSAPTSNGEKEEYERPECEIRILEGEGHGLMASPLIMGDVLTEIAGYWTLQEKGRVVPA